MTVLLPVPGLNTGNCLMAVLPIRKRKLPTKETIDVSVFSQLLPRSLNRSNMNSYTPNFSYSFPQISLLFLRGHFCWAAVVKLNNDWHVSLDSKKEVGVIAIDLSNAFASICRNLLVAKLKSYALVNLQSSWFVRNFLNVSNEWSVTVFILIGCQFDAECHKEVYWDPFCSMMSLSTSQLFSYTQTIQRNRALMNLPLFSSSCWSKTSKS